MASLGQVLAVIASLRDVPRLVAALGYEPLWEETTADAWSGPLDPHIARAAVVGRAGGFEWVAVEAPEPGRAAQSIARRLTQRGWSGGVIGLYPDGRRMAISVAFDQAPMLEMELLAPGRLALACLARLALAAPAEGSALALAGRVADALAGEGVGRHFFERFRATLERMAASLPDRLGADDRHALALLQLTRVLFVYFVQSKGWLDGRSDFLSRQVDGCLGRRRRIHRDLLRPLFFGTLNRRLDQRGRAAAAFGRIPFLNGGLFEPHPLERRWRGDIPNPVWRDAFDNLFERFHFTAGEREAHGAIAPDMLGRVFEGVMQPETRRASGTFYTPAALVRSLLDAGLTALLAQRLGCPEPAAARQLEDPGPAAAAVLRSLTLLDPAVGSGAFLLGALERLSDLRARHGGPISDIRREILRENLFGVDINPAAVRLAELRLWLAVIAEDPTERPEQVQPLPNLDCLIRQGDSLVDPLGGIPGVRTVPSGGASALANLRRRVIVATGGEKRVLLGDLRRAELAAARRCLESAEQSARREVQQWLDDARGLTLFGDRQKPTPHSRARFRELRAGLRSIGQLRRRLVRAGEVPWFHYESHFADVFARGGFDLVVGNPPWVRAEQIPRAVRERLAGRYRWWRPSGKQGYANRPDLALAFVERAYELVAPQGAIALLLPAKIATATYGCTARHALATQATLHAVADLTGHSEADFDATVYPLALIASKTRAESGHRVRTTLGLDEAVTVAQERLKGGGPWILVRDELQAALTSLQAEHPRCGDRFTCHLGLKTGANPIFLGPADVEPSLLRWAIRGRDVRAFAAEGRTRLLWTHGADGRPLPRLPPRAAAYLAAHERVLRGRADYDGGPPWTLFRTGPATAAHRVIWADLARRLSAAALSGAMHAESVPLNSCYVAVARNGAEARRLAAWFNCSWIRAAARLGATPAIGGFIRLNARTVSALPLPSSVLTDPELDALARAASRGEQVQHDLDCITARHLGLSRSACRALRTVVGADADDRR